MGNSRATNRRSKPATTREKYAAWNRIATRAKAKLSRSIPDGATREQLVTAVRGYVCDMEEIPASVRAMETAMQEAERLVSILSSAGVRFASKKNAPAQIAACAYAAWSDCHNRAAAPVDWMGIVQFLADGIEYSLAAKTGVPPYVRGLVAGGASPRRKPAPR